MTLDEIKANVGLNLGHSQWHEVTQERVNRFAEATGDFQWIHVDVERAAAGPFGTTIAHGYLTLSMLGVLLPEIFDPSPVSMGVNYGCNRVRFPSPVPVGSRLRLSGVLVAADELPGGVQTVLNLTFEIDGGNKPVCVAEAVGRFYY